ncbi:MAG: hypothetical protein K1X92_04885 [Bacteroidia bacterium]|nr:hypothetical protein [Bacteroidia bacterium]
MLHSKPLSGDDSSGFEFVQETLKGDPTCAINFDRLQFHPVQGYIIFEFLLCEESQSVTPYTSHPNRYWHKNSQKFIALFKAAQALNAKLYLVNYARKGTRHENEVLIIEVFAVTKEGITTEKTYKTDRLKFSEWFRKLNKECCEATE